MKIIIQDPLNAFIRTCLELYDGKEVNLSRKNLITAFETNFPTIKCVDLRDKVLKESAENLKRNLFQRFFNPEVYSFILDRVVYCPSEINVRDGRKIYKPNDYGMLNYEDLFLIQSDSVLLNCCLIKSKHFETKFTFYYLHGNSGSIEDCLQFSKYLYNRINCNIFLIDYRGYGLSNLSSKPICLNEFNIDLDAQTGLDYLLSREDIQKTKIVLIGHSLGGAIAINLLKKEENLHKIHACILENTFTSLMDVLNYHVKNFRFLKKFNLNLSKSDFLLSNKYESFRNIKNLQVPLLILCSREDKVVPYWMSQILNLEASNSKLKFLKIFSDMDHNDLFLHKDYYQNLKCFLDLIE